MIAILFVTRRDSRGKIRITWGLCKTLHVLAIVKIFGWVAKSCNRAFKIPYIFLTFGKLSMPISQWWLILSVLFHKNLFCRCDKVDILANEKLYNGWPTL